jgi:hypothetical protein
MFFGLDLLWEGKDKKDDREYSVTFDVGGAVSRALQTLRAAIKNIDVIYKS